MKPDKKYCRGCHDDCYNHDNPQQVQECWHFEHAKVVTKYCIGWWTPQDKKDNFGIKIITNSCHSETGRFAYYDKLPEHLTRRVKV